MAFLSETICKSASIGKAISSFLNSQVYAIEISPQSVDSLLMIMSHLVLLLLLSVPQLYNPVHLHSFIVFFTRPKNIMRLEFYISNHSSIVGPAHKFHAKIRCTGQMFTGAYFNDKGCSKFMYLLSTFSR